MFDDYEDDDEEETIDSLADAAKAGDLAAIRRFVDEGVDINAVDFITTPLMEAAAANQLEAAKLLLELGADVNATDNSYMPRTALFEAVSEGHEEMARFLLAHQADPNAMFMTHGGTARNCLEYLKNMKKDASSSLYQLLIAHGAILPTMFDMLDKYPEQASALTESFVTAEKYPQALELIDYLLKKQPESALHYQRGVALDMTGCVDKATAEFDTAIRMDPQNYRAYYSRALQLQRKGNWAPSIPELEQALQINPKDYYSSNALARALLHLPERTQQDVQRAVELATAACDDSGWDDVLCIRTLSEAYRAAGNDAKADEIAPKAEG